ncbi:MAG: helix-turn-helix domain-containing protein, partial [Actinobacteria bacterium]|nr:helix-turn-helix domain-containing protein [Actinomycetota bacterium]
MRAIQRRQARQALDDRFGKLERSALAAPRMGWIRAIRDALGLSTRQLADRLDVSGPAVTGLEASERAGTIQLDTLRRVAAAMECEVVYAL